MPPTDPRSAKAYRQDLQAVVNRLRADMSAAIAAGDTSYGALVIIALEELTDSEQGYGRWGKQQTGARWARWKWTQGDLAGRYTYGSGPTLTEAFDALLNNISAVLSGKLHASIDKGYHQ